MRKPAVYVDCFSPRQRNTIAVGIGKPELTRCPQRMLHAQVKYQCLAERDGYSTQKIKGNSDKNYCASLHEDDTPSQVSPLAQKPSSHREVRSIKFGFLDFPSKRAYHPLALQFVELRRRLYIRLQKKTNDLFVGEDGMCWLEGEKNHSRNRVGKNRIQPTGTEEEGIWRGGKQNVNAQSRHERCAISARCCRAEKVCSVNVE